MSNTTETQAPANLRTTRKELAASKTPAKKAPAKSPAKKAADKGTVYTYEAGPSRAGVTNVRRLHHEAVLAADVQDPQHPSRRWQAGVITRMFATEEMAKRYQERLESEGCNVVLLPVRLVSKEA